MGRTYFPASAAGRGVACATDSGNIRDNTTCRTFIVRFAPAVTHVYRAGNYVY